MAAPRQPDLACLTRSRSDGWFRREANAATWRVPLQIRPARSEPRFAHFSPHPTRCSRCFLQQIFSEEPSQCDTNPLSGNQTDSPV
jgi:hypothetical protein